MKIVLAAALALALAGALAGCTGSDAPPPQAAAPKVGVPDPQAATYAPQLGVQLAAFYKTPNGVYYQDTKTGTGMAAAPGARVFTKYEGWLPDGTRFDGGAIDFRLAQGDVIRGWDEGIQGMRVGGVRKLVIPAELAYGSDGSPPDIPPNATLVFQVELTDVK
jgi:FKBP-type peptidyl-prolyl cis-trans isomerase FkpA